MRKVKLTVGNMHCQGCVEIVRHVLEREDGVVGCVVSLEEHEARLAIDPERTSTEHLAGVLSNAGYPASAPD